MTYLTFLTLGAPGSAFPSKPEAMRWTDLSVASLYFSSVVSTGMVSEITLSRMSLPTLLIKDGPPEIDPSFPVLTTTRTPFLSPCSMVGYQVSNTLSENSNGSGVN